MVKLPIRADLWANLGRVRMRNSKIKMAMTLGFFIITLDHCRRYSKKITDSKIEEITKQISNIASDEKSKQEMMKIFGINNST